MVDIQWLNRISHRLERFSRTSPSTHVYQARCPVCGDSQKDKRKARLYFYEVQRALNAHCKNCGYSRSFWNFMKDVFPNDFVQYKKDQMKESLESLKASSLSSKPDPVGNIKQEKKVKPRAAQGLLDGCLRLSDAPQDNVGLKYAKSRQLPEHTFGRLWYCNNFKSVAEHVSYRDLSDGFPTDQRLVIPFFDKDGKTIIGLQGRALGDVDKRQRYITIKASAGIKKIYGLDRLDSNKTIYCVEGPLDSLFLPNCVATCDSYLLSANADVYIFDNEPRNKQIVGFMEEAIKQNKSVVVWPKMIEPGTDLNDMIMAGLTENDLLSLINQYTFHGLKARMKLSEWRQI